MMKNQTKIYEFVVSISVFTYIEFHIHMIIPNKLRNKVHILSTTEISYACSKETRHSLSPIYFFMIIISILYNSFTPNILDFCFDLIFHQVETTLTSFR